VTVTLRKAWNACLMSGLRPYIWHELPGWGRLYDGLVGNYTRNAQWQGHAPRWIRGKLHGLQIPIDLSSWSNREAFFVGRYFDSGNQIILKALVKPGETVVDIGANEGMITLMAAHVVGPAGKVISFEPNPRPRGVLTKALSRNGLDWVDVRPFGVSDERAVLQMTIPQINSGEGSFGRPDYDSAEMDVIEAQVVVGDEELVGETPRLVKIDVEGYELHVLKGLRETLARAKPMVSIEVVRKHLENAGTSPEEIADLFASHGYRGWKVSHSGRGRRLRVALLPPVLTPDLWDDFLWVHQDDPVAGEVEALLARTPMY
jgi:FkbM family methyltransferase